MMRSDWNWNHRLCAHATLHQERRQAFLSGFGVGALSAALFGFVWTLIVTGMGWGR
jgi:hypothetical protein